MDNTSLRQTRREEHMLAISAVKHSLIVVAETDTCGCTRDSSNFIVKGVRKGFVTERISKNITENIKV